jgi:hypothetical protein
MDNIIQSQLEAYRDNFIQHGDTPRGTYQNNLATIEERHRQLIANLLPYLPKNFTLCDFGAGTCDLHGYLIKNGIDHQYTGIEIVPEMREAARIKYPGIRIVGDNILNEDYCEKFDVIVASGTFNLRKEMASEPWEEYVLTVVSKMFKISEVGIAYNVLTSYSDFREETLYYMSPETAISHAQSKLSRFCCLSTLWPLYEFTLTVLKPTALAKHFKRDEFSKYFRSSAESEKIRFA